MCRLRDNDRRLPEPGDGGAGGCARRHGGISRSPRIAAGQRACSRIHIRLSLGEATAGDTAEYVIPNASSWLRTRDVFSSDALALKHEASRGHLRDLDRIATSCLKLAAKRKQRIVDRNVVARVQQQTEPLDEAD